MPMPKKTQVALNRGRRKAGLKPIRFGAKKKKPQKGDLSEKNLEKNQLFSGLA